MLFHVFFVCLGIIMTERATIDDFIKIEKLGEGIVVVFTNKCQCKPST